MVFLKTAASPFLNHTNNIGSRRVHPNKTYFLSKNATVSRFSFVHVTFFFTQSTRIFLC